MTVVLDASAVLALLHSEPGADSVRDALAGGAVCGAANWSEVAQKSLHAGRNWGEARAWLLNGGLRVEPVTAADAEWATRRWQQREGLSLGDRLCLALGHRLDSPVLTADPAWADLPGVRLIR